MKRFYRTIARNAFALCALAASTAAAQSTAIIRGAVRDSSTGRGVPSAQVQIVGTTRGTLTDSVGDYVFRDLPAGAHTVRAQRIGYAAASRAVRVAAGETVSADLSLTAVIPQ